ncbi:MAG: Zn-dependent hydrolase [Hyphomicrobiaceae bacterium]|nr:Zn-dependent hydrolase [Hyphomicrobiaceae bacterium]
MSQSHNLAINGSRLWDALMEMAKIGATAKGGCNRQALTDLDKQGRDLFVRWCKDAGCSVAVDQIGNIFARREGADASLPPVMFGSHLDTQPTGGKFDGVLGTLAALEVVCSLNDLRIKTRHPIEIAMWTNEEGARFSPAMTASGVFAGAFSLAYTRALKDFEGKSFGDELDRIGYAGALPVGGRPVHAFFELHIEQGPILEEEGTDIGIVVAAQGQRWYEIDIVGQDSHAGSTPMERRRDALLGAARLIDGVNRIGRMMMPDGRATCGVITVSPASRNVIPGRAFLTAEVRHPDELKLEVMARALANLASDVSRELGLEIAIKQTNIFPAQPFDTELLDIIRKAASTHGLSHRDIVSGAGHDAVYLARVCPAAMIFVPCVGGISHNEAEDCKPQWVTNGANVLLQAVLAKAEIVAQ